MITTTMRRLVPEEFISPLKMLGKYDWLRWTPRIRPRPPHKSSCDSPMIRRCSSAAF